MFCDEITLKLRAGNGGNGGLSFRREKYVPKGGPDGGDGGKGGDLIVRVNPNVNTLYHLTSRKLYTAQSGESGMGNHKYGKSGEDFILDVPPGTLILNKDKTHLYADLGQNGEQIVIARGGKGGLGNSHFATSTHQTPRFAETGEPGEELDVILELKLVADVGIIGLPSAGKSTLISVVSNARPKIAAYHFTTLVPNLGVVSMSKFGGDQNDTFVVADMPGLIEGASKGVGLGIQFLKHINRTKLLIHLIDGFIPDIGKNYKTIRDELKKYDKTLTKREEIIVINKLDILTDESLKKQLKELKKVTKSKKIFVISAVTHEGLKPLMFEISKKLAVLKKSERKEIAARPKQIPILRPHLEKVKYKIDKIEKTKEYKRFYVSGQRLNQIASMTTFSNQEGMERMYDYINKIGLKRTLTKNKAILGDFIIIKGKALPYRP
ncbi:MAG: GTPase ObgE [Candidatus Gracilibacteria bacterium]|jgi:GTP-binding protein